MSYRVYCLDGAGHLHDPEWISAASDDDAIAQIRAKRPDAMCEIWQRRRFVASLSPSHIWG